MTAGPVPAYSQQFLPGSLREIHALGPIAAITPEWAWGGSTGRGVKVAVVDSGIEYDHPAVGGQVVGGVIISYNETENDLHYQVDDQPIDVAGHGTACAGIIHFLAPEAELYSVRVLGKNMGGRAITFAGGLDWAVDHSMDVANLSLSTNRKEYYGLFHELTDSAYFKNMILVSAVNNIPDPS